MHALNGWLCSMYVFRLFGGELKLKLIEFVLQRTSFDLLAGHDKIARFETQLKHILVTTLHFTPNTHMVNIEQELQLVYDQSCENKQG